MIPTYGTISSRNAAAYPENIQFYHRRLYFGQVNQAHRQYPENTG